MFQPLADLETAAPAMVVNLQVIHPAKEAPASHHSILMLVVHEWHPFLVLLEGMVLEVVLEVDLVAMILTHVHPVGIAIERNTRCSP